MGSLEGETVNDNRARAGARIGARMAAWGLWRFSWAVWVANAERVRPLLPGMSGLVLGLAAGLLYVATPFVLAVWSRKDGNGFARTALEAAGGPTEDADLEAINLARRLYDEDQVMVPRRGQVVSPGRPVSQVAGSSMGRININTASAELLDTLPGIGEVYSQRIIDSRTSNGPFERVEDLLERRLIPRSTFEKIKDLITVGP